PWDNSVAFELMTAFATPDAERTTRYLSSDAPPESARISFSASSKFAAVPIHRMRRSVCLRNTSKRGFMRSFSPQAGLTESGFVCTIDAAYRTTNQMTDAAFIVDRPRNLRAPLCPAGFPRSHNEVLREG